MVPVIDLAIVGAQKAATTALLRYLGQQPSIQVHRTQEMTFFVNEEEWRGGWADARARYGLDAPHLLTVVKSAALMHDDEAVHRLAEHSPEARIAVALRDPAERAYSAFWYCRSRGLEPCADFDEALWAGTERFEGDPIAKIACDYLGNSRYAPAVRQLQQTFGMDRVHILRNEDLRAGPIATYNILRALGLEPAEEATAAPRVNRAAKARSQRLAGLLAHRGGARAALRAVVPIEARRSIRNTVRGWNRVDFAPPAMAPSTRERLVAHFTPDIEIVEAMTGWDLSAWKAVPR